LFSGTEVNNSEQTKIVSAAEPAPANDEYMQGTRHTLLDCDSFGLTLEG
jgi:hypothetical protein